MEKVLSFGAGVNSTALLVLHATGKINVDMVVFADTHNELPETYEHIENVVKPWCLVNSLAFLTVDKGNLFTDYYDKHVIPFRIIRSCTDHYKIRPIHKACDIYYGKNNYVTILGIDYGERHRAERYEDRSPNARFQFPLIDMQINRNGCKKLIKDFGWKIPVKSGCFFCPFTRKQGWIDLLRKHPRLFILAEDFEKNSRLYPKYTLTSKPLEEIRKKWRKIGFLENWMDKDGEACVYCHG